MFSFQYLENNANLADQYIDQLNWHYFPITKQPTNQPTNWNTKKKIQQKNREVKFFGWNELFSWNLNICIFTGQPLELCRQGAQGKCVDNSGARGSWSLWRGLHAQALGLWGSPDGSSTLTKVSLEPMQGCFGQQHRQPKETNINVYRGLFYTNAAQYTCVSEARYLR